MSKSKTMVKMIVVAALAATQAFASSKVEDALTLNADAPCTAKKTDPKSKCAAPARSRIFDSLGTTDTQKTELPKNARHDATAGVFI